MVSSSSIAILKFKLLVQMLFLLHCEWEHTVREVSSSKGEKLQTTVISYYCIKNIVLGEGVIHCAIISHFYLLLYPPGFRNSK